MTTLATLRRLDERLEVGDGHGAVAAVAEVDDVALAADHRDGHGGGRAQAVLGSIRRAGIAERECEQCALTVNGMPAVRHRMAPPVEQGRYRLARVQSDQPGERFAHLRRMYD